MLWKPDLHKRESPQQLDNSINCGSIIYWITNRQDQFFYDGFYDHNFRVITSLILLENASTQYPDRITSSSDIQYTIKSMYRYIGVGGGGCGGVNWMWIDTSVLPDGDGNPIIREISINTTRNLLKYYSNLPNLNENGFETTESWLECYLDATYIQFQHVNKRNFNEYYPKSTLILLEFSKLELKWPRNY